MTSVSIGVLTGFLECLQNSDYKQLRMLIVRHGLPDESMADIDAHEQGGYTLRGRVWHMLLTVGAKVEYNYTTLWTQGRHLSSNRYGCMSADIPRLHEYEDRICLKAAERVLIAFVNSGEVGATKVATRYAQGMSRWCGMFLNEMPEDAAFACLRAFAVDHCPRYIESGYPGAYDGLALFEECLALVAPKLSQHLKEQVRLPLVVVAFPPILGFLSTIPVLAERQHLWDLMLAFGAHLNVLFLMSHILLQRQQLMATASPLEVKAMFDPQGSPSVLLHARSTAHLAMRVLPLIPDDLYQRLARHPYVSA